MTIWCGTQVMRATVTLQIVRMLMQPLILLWGTYPQTESPNSHSSTLILENSETNEADTSATELLYEPQYVPASSSSSSVSEPHNSSQAACHCRRSPIWNSHLLPFRLPLAYRHQQNNCNSYKATWMAVSLRCTFNLSQTSLSEPDENPMQDLDNDPSWNPIFAVNPYRPAGGESEPECRDDTPYSPTNSPYSPSQHSPDSPKSSK